MNILNNIRNWTAGMMKRKGKGDATPKDALLYQATYNYAVSLFHLGQDWAYDHAIDHFKKIISDLSLSKSKTAIEISELARGSLACTYAKLAERKPKQREQLCALTFEQTKYLLVNTTNTEAKALALTANGLAYLSLDNCEMARKAFNDSLDYDENITALLGLGETYRKEGDYTNAILTYQKASELTSAGGYASYRLGNIFRELGEKEKAIEAYKQSSSLSVARLSLGKIYLEDGELEAALEEFRNAVRINRRNSEAWINIAWTILEMQTTDGDLINEGVDAARRSLQIDINSPNEWHRRTVLSLCLIAAQKPEPALKEAHLGLNLAQDRAQAQYCVAFCEFHLNRRDNARKILLDILRSDIRGLWRNKAESLMKELNVMKSEG